MTKSSGTTRSLYITIALCIFVLDRWTKFIVAQKIQLFDSISVVPGFFKITHLRNTGAAFSLFADAPATWRMIMLVLFSSIALVIVIVLLVRNSHRFTWNGFALALILGGALGNLWDRVLHGWVTDFLLVYYKNWEWPAFNVADSAICVGATLLIAEMLFRREHAPAHETHLAKE